MIGFLNKMLFFYFSPTLGLTSKKKKFKITQFIINFSFFF